MPFGADMTEHKVARRFYTIKINCAFRTKFTPRLHLENIMNFSYILSLLFLTVQFKQSDLYVSLTYRNQLQTKFKILATNHQLRIK